VRAAGRRCRPSSARHLALSRREADCRLERYDGPVMNLFLRTSCLTALLVCVSLPAQCPGGWQPGFGGTSSDDVVFASVVFDDGSGPHLYASGKFGGLGSGGSVVAVHAAGSWGQVGANAEAHAFAVWDDGTGAALYAAGDWPVG